MKLALRYIPTEVWVDIFCFPWISRKELGKIVDKLGNRYFTEILQYCLHERGKRSLGTLNLNKKTLPVVPRTPMPENIKFFKDIVIWHFDSSAIAFLRNMNTLFTDVNLRFTGHWTNNDMTNIRAVLDHLSPLLYGIHSMEFNQRLIPLVQQYFGPNMAKVKMLNIHWINSAGIQARINFCLNWLASEERDPTDEPRLLKVHICGADNLQQFCMATKQQFLSAKNPSTFAIEALYFDDNNAFTVFHLKNNLGEQLDGHINELGIGNIQIDRHKQMDSARTQLQEWVNKTAEKSLKSSGIELFDTTTIGPIDANAGANEVDVDGGEDDDQPSTSKKPKLS